ncbi:hypothetical protein SAMN02745123_00533 [Desulforamulus aeronauticus DSM 10349]|uniref:Uncharacterized protein n=1 Tax=Desulforamulus aeronauticus DSM 10349 TaxID=1121421 RepID=A0A1M6PEE8_9FIRM|nr:hypothetical protein SAMN02745123_00533 [Desulforamulus aeronauticus DSM 10349]
MPEREKLTKLSYIRIKKQVFYVREYSKMKNTQIETVKEKNYNIWELYLTYPTINIRMKVVRWCIVDEYKSNRPSR